jgi:acyl-CoA hydrolase
VSSIEGAIADLRTGSRLAISDGVGSPRGLLGIISECARRQRGLSLLFGWMPGPVTGLAAGSFTDVRAVMGGYGLRRAIDDGSIRYVPARFGALPSLLQSGAPLAVDLLVTSAVPVRGGFRFGTEMSWLPSAIEGGARVVIAVNRHLPTAGFGPVIPHSSVVATVDADGPPLAVPSPEPSCEARVVGEQVARLVPEDCRVQYAPGMIASAALDAIRSRVAVDTGILTDGVLALERRGLLVDVPTAAYLAGSDDLYEWADTRPIVRPVTFTHDAARLLRSPRPLVAINTALQVDLNGQVNVESADGSMVGGVGGQPDYAAAAASSRGGMSIVALPATHRGHSTLVERLDAPVSTARHDVEIVVTEYGVADLRGLDALERRTELLRVWGPVGLG